MQIGHWQFSPGLIPGITTILVLPLLVSLGLWQLDRAEQKRVLYQDFLARQEEAPVRLDNQKMLGTNNAEMIWRHVYLSGQFMPGAEILLDNQIQDGKPGYLVFTPFRISGEDKLVLVNRGWIAGSGNRSDVPVINTPSHEVELRAVVTEAPATGIVLGESLVETVATGIYRVQRINFDEIRQLVNHDFLSYIVRLEPESDYGFLRQWQIPGSGEEKHLGYAFQWFALAITLVIIFLAVNIKKVA